MDSFLKTPSSTNITLLQVKLSSDSLSKILGSSFVDKKRSWEEKFH